jgi:predicted ribosomally synthesized peptide with nif11-like leader
VSEEQLKAFLEAVKADTGLQEKLKAAADADAVVAIAKAAGFVISVEEIEAQAAQKIQPYELSDEELEFVAGGNVLYEVGAAAGCLVSTISLCFDSHRIAGCE